MIFYNKWKRKSKKKELTIIIIKQLCKIYLCQNKNILLYYVRHDVFIKWHYCYNFSPNIDFSANLSFNFSMKKSLIITKLFSLIIFFKEISMKCKRL